MELSYFPEVLVCEADSSVGGEGFVFRAANGPKASRGPVHGFALQSGQGNRELGAAEAQQGARRETACQSKGTDLSDASCRWRDGWTGGQAQHCPVRVPEELRKYYVPIEGL